MLGLNFLRKADVCLGKLCNLLFFKNLSKRNLSISYKRILLIKLWGLGNLTVIWPLIYKIKKKYKRSEKSKENR